MNFPLLFSWIEVDPYRLIHRIVMAPLTRMRAEKESFAPRPLNAEYYRQRATPGIYSDQQIEGEEIGYTGYAAYGEPERV